MKENSNREFLKTSSGVKFQVFGDSLEKAFSNSLVAMFASMHHGSVKSNYSHKVKIKGISLENLLYNFLEKFVYLFREKNVFVSRVDIIKIDKNNNELECVVSGDLAKYYDVVFFVRKIKEDGITINREKGFWAFEIILET